MYAILIQYMIKAAAKAEWTAVQIPVDMKNDIVKYLKSSDAKKRGFVSISGYVAHCIRKDQDSR